MKAGETSGREELPTGQAQQPSGQQNLVPDDDIVKIKMEQATSELAAISLQTRIPDFWTDMPRLWFAQFETVMGPQKQGDAEKFNVAVAKLSRDALRTVGDLIRSPPAEHKYEALKNRLLTAFEESEESQFSKLVSEIQLGTQKPSQLLRRMAELARNSGTSDASLKKLWVGRLPSAVRAVLAVSKETDLESLAQMADKIVENIRTGDVLEVTTASSSSAAEASALPELLTQMRALSLQLQNLRGEVSEIRGRSQERGYRNNGRNQSRSRSRSNGPGRNPRSPDWLCNYHYRYGARARRCETPCNWGRQQQPSQQQMQQQKRDS